MVYLTKIESIEKKNDMICLGNVPPIDNDLLHQRNWVYSEKGINPTLTATMYKDPTRVLVRINQ